MAEKIINQPWEDVADDVVAAIEKAVQPLIKQASADIYAGLLDTTQDYLRNNLAFNIAERISAAECQASADRIEADRLRGVNAALLEALKLKQRFGRKVEEADRARRVAAQRSEEIHKLEERVAHQSSNITSLCNEIASLKRELRPFRAPRPRGPNGWYLSDAQIAAHNHHVSQVMDSMTQVQS